MGELLAKIYRCVGDQESEVNVYTAPANKFDSPEAFEAFLQARVLELEVSEVDKKIAEEARQAAELEAKAAVSRFAVAEVTQPKPLDAELREQSLVVVAKERAVKLKQVDGLSEEEALVAANSFLSAAGVDATIDTLSES